MTGQATSGVADSKPKAMEFMNGPIHSTFLRADEDTNWIDNEI
jgi:hypothetical protein